MNIIKNIAVALTLMTGLSAHATIISFDTITGGGPNSSYTESGFTFEPAGSTADIKCWDGKCLKEVQQGLVTRMTGDSNNSPFELDYFYFSLIGKTTTANNSFTLVGTKTDDSEIKAVFVEGDAIGPFSTDATLSFAKGLGGTTDNGFLQKNLGYWVDLGEQWTSLVSVDWFSNTAGGPQDGQYRLDCIGVQGEVRDGGCTVSNVPEPNSLALLGLGIVGLSLVRRKKR
jgi:PEP-CTERM motif